MAHSSAEASSAALARPHPPRGLLKVNADYAVTDKWKLGGNLIYTSSQFFFGDASNQNPKLPGYWVVTKTPLPGVANPSDPRFVPLAAPVAVFGGIRVTF
jgi:hypothetical protein